MDIMRFAIEAASEGSEKQDCINNGAWCRQLG